MNSTITDLPASDPSNSPTVYFCPCKTVYTWILTETGAFYTSIVTKAIASPITIFLNVLVIVAVNKRKELYKNSNILLASMAVADLMVGAVSMPLTASYDILLLRKDLSLTICKLAFANQIVLYGAVSSSFYHLTVIAFERYVAIKMWKDYKVIVTKTRVKIWAFMAWIIAVLSTTPARIMTAAEVDDTYLNIVNGVSAFKTVLCVALIGYCYMAAYLSVRTRHRSSVSQDASFSKAKVENAVAKAMGILTTVLFVSYIPSVLVLSLGGIFPFFRTSSFFRWSELLLQLNSLLNPILYCFVLNRIFRKEVLEMLKIKKRDERPNSLSVERRPRRNVVTAFVEEVPEIQQEAQRSVCINNAMPMNVGIPLSDSVISMPSSSTNNIKGERAMSCPAKTGGNEFGENKQEPGLVNRALSWPDGTDHSDTVRQIPNSVNNQLKMKRHISLPFCKENRVYCVDVHHPNSTTRKPHGVQVNDLPLEEGQSRSEDKNRHILLTGSTQTATEQSLPVSSVKESLALDVTPSENHEHIRSRGVAVATKCEGLQDLERPKTQ